MDAGDRIEVADRVHQRSRGDLHMRKAADQVDDAFVHIAGEAECIGVGRPDDDIGTRALGAASHVPQNAAAHAD